MDQSNKQNKQKIENAAEDPKQASSSLPEVDPRSETKNPQVILPEGSNLSQHVFQRVRLPDGRIGLLRKVSSIPGQIPNTQLSNPKAKAIGMNPAPVSTSVSSGSVISNQKKIQPRGRTVSAKHQNDYILASNCRSLLFNLMKEAGKISEELKEDVRILIQKLVDGVLEPRDFCSKLETLLDAIPEPTLLTFLIQSISHFRHFLSNNVVKLDGIRSSNLITRKSTIHDQLTSQVLHPVAGSSQSISKETLPTQSNKLIKPDHPVAGSSKSVSEKIVAVQSHRSPQVLHSVAGSSKSIGQETLETESIKSFKDHRPVAGSSKSIGQEILATQSNKSIKAHHLVAESSTSNETIVAQRHIGSVKVSRMVIRNRAEKEIGGPRCLANTKLKSSPVVMPSKKDKEHLGVGVDINAVTTVDGVNLTKDSDTESDSEKENDEHLRSFKDRQYLRISFLQDKINKIVKNFGLDETEDEVAILMAQAVEKRVKNLLEELSIIGEHRTDVLKLNPLFEISQDVKGQLRFLKELDKAENENNAQVEREFLLLAAKSRAKRYSTEEHNHLREKGKEIQRMEKEHLQNLNTNRTALQAIGSRKTLKFGIDSVNKNFGNVNRQLPLRPRIKRINLIDLVFLLQREKKHRKSLLLYKLFLKLS